MFNSRFVPLACTVLSAVLVSTAVLPAQGQVQDRISRKIDARVTTPIRGHLHPLATADHDRGPVSPTFKLARITMVFKMTDAQQNALNDFVNRQQDPASADYHRWLSPEQFAGRFGVSANDRNQVVSWLQDQGFTVNEVGRNGRAVTFTGSARQVESAFHASIHQYEVDGETFYANSAEPSVPAAFADLVLGFRSLNNFRLKPRATRRAVDVTPQFTSQLTGNHFVSPSDFATIYNVNPLYSAGIDGTGQSIAIVGQTDINLSDIRAFRSAAGLPQNDPSVVLVPGLGDPGIVNGDLDEAHLDLEWSGAVAPRAHLIYVNSSNVLDSFQYAIDQNLAPVVSISYGGCEKNFSAQDVSLLSALTQQANAQGMTLIAASGDSGAADCEGHNAKVATQGLSVDLPSSLPSVTGLGGSEFRDTTTSWSPTSTATYGSALSYIPEGTWNDTSLTGTLSSGGGGRSIYFSKPGWQSVAGVPNDFARDVPDLSFNASPDHDGYLMCSGGSCVNGFRASNGNLSVVGGTSVAAPAFAGVIALINQKTNSLQGNVNPVLYSLAATTPSAFHDIITGGNQVPCAAGTVDCPNGGNIGYAAGVGYDQATGLGSADAASLASVWPMPQTAVTPSPTPPATTSTSTSTGTSNPVASPTSTPTTAPQPISVVEQGAIRSGYALITPDAGSSLPTPTVTFGIVNSGSVQAQAGITPIPMITDGALYVDVVPGIGRNLGVAIVNAGNDTNVVTLTLRGPSGNTVGAPAALTLAPHQQVARFVTELFSADVVGGGFTGSLRLQASSSFGALGLRFSGSEFSTSPVGVTVAGTDGNSAIALPQFAMGGGWATQFALVNNGNSAISGRIDIYDQSGNPISVNLNGSTQSSFTYSVPAGGTFVLAPRDSNGQSPF